MNHDWVAKARQELLALGGQSPGWAYQPGGTPSVEPTALACLALAASDPDHSTSDARSIVRAAAEWLATIQQSDGSLGVSATLPTPSWPTPYAILLWTIQGLTAQQEKAASWLLNTRGTTFPRDSNGPNGHDSTLAGWPWVAETHSWLEPTALAVLALNRVGLGRHPRTSEGVRLILDRAIETGGWNYGNAVVFGTNLRPQPGPTGLALTALAGGKAPEVVVQRACRYLESALPNTRSAQSLCWGLLGLTAWSRNSPEADRWLAEGYRQAVRRSDRAPQLAYLLLAFAREQSLHLLGIEPQNENIANGSERA